MTPNGGTTVDSGRIRRFCLVTTFYPPSSFGGDGIFVRNLARELARRGHEVDVVHHLDAFRALGGREREAAAEELPNLRVHALSAGAGALEPLLMHQTGRPILLRRRLRELLGRPYDVLHFHNVSLVGGPEVLEYGRGVKLYTTHEAWLVCPTHTLFRFNRAPCERPHCFACSLVHRRPPQGWRSTGLLARATGHVDAFLAPSASIARLHRERGLELPFVHLPSFVPDPEETSDPAGAEPAAAGGRPYFLFAGRLERLKGAHTLLPIFARLPDAELVVAGAGNEERALRAAVRSANVRFVGHQPAAALRRLYRGARAVIVPSLCHEVFPLVALEALREGTPIVVPNRGALPEVVEESAGGIVYADEAGLLAALERLLTDPAHRDRLGAQGARAFRARWTAELHLERYFALIEGIEEAKRRSA